MDIKLYSYLFGLFGTDGSVCRNKTNKHIYRLVIELVDKDILEKISDVLPNCTLVERVRDTNFKKNHHSYVLYCANKDFIKWCEDNKLPLFDKTNNVAPPIKDYIESDFWRGVIDGDGSIGIKTIDGQPFISLVTKSEFLKESFCDYIYKITDFRPNIHRNKRDNIYNIAVHGEKAQKICASLYNDADIYLDRKYQSYLEIIPWHKKDMHTVTRKKWTQEEEEDLLKMTNEEFHQKHPERTLVAIRGKRNKLKKGELK